MTTARERYEAKTRVVTFRVNQALYEDLEQVRKEAGLSFADLIKLGAGIAREEINQKLAEMSKLQTQLAELRRLIRDERKTLDAFVDEAKKEQLAKLDHDYQIYRLFDAGWSIEEVSLKLGINQKDAYNHFKDWGEMRKQKQLVQAELLKKCLKRHIDFLVEQIFWSGHVAGRITKEGIEELRRQVDHCHYLIGDLSKLRKEEKAFLISEYSRFIH